MQTCPVRASALEALMIDGPVPPTAIAEANINLQEFSSVGRASVSKTEGRGFESPNSCHFMEMTEGRCGA